LRAAHAVCTAHATPAADYFDDAEIIILHAAMPLIAMIYALMPLARYAADFAAFAADVAMLPRLPASTSPRYAIDTDTPPPRATPC